MRLCWSRVGSESNMSGVLIRREKFENKEGDVREDSHMMTRGRDWREASIRPSISGIVDTGS